MRIALGFLLYALVASVLIIAFVLPDSPDTSCPHGWTFRDGACHSPRGGQVESYEEQGDCNAIVLRDTNDMKNMIITNNRIITDGEPCVRIRLGAE